MVFHITLLYLSKTKILYEGNNMEKKGVRVSYRLHTDLYEALRKAAYEERRSQNNLVEEALQIFFSQHKKNSITKASKV